MAVFNKAIFGILAIVIISVLTEETGEPELRKGFYYDSSMSKSDSINYSESDISYGHHDSDSELETSLSYGDVYGHHSKPKETEEISISWSAEVPNYKPQKCPEVSECKKQFNSVNKMIDLLQDEKESTMRLIKTKLYKSKDLDEEANDIAHKNHQLQHKMEMQNNKIRSQNMTLDGQAKTMDEIQLWMEEMKEVVHDQSDRCERNLRGVKLEEGPFGIYHFHNDELNLRNWFGANDWCRQHGMILAAAETAAENIWISSRIAEILDHGSGSHSHSHSNSEEPTTAYWFGLSNLANHHYLIHDKYDTKHHQWFWYATGTESTYFNWAVDEPTNDRYRSSEQDFDSESTSNPHFLQRCVGMALDENDNIRWYDEDCLLKIRFVCELVDPCPMKGDDSSKSEDIVHNFSEESWSVPVSHSESMSW